MADEIVEPKYNIVYSTKAAEVYHAKMREYFRKEISLEDWLKWLDQWETEKLKYF